MLIATFNDTTGWAGKAITHESAMFMVEGRGPISARDLMRYDEYGQLTWADTRTRTWVAQVAEIEVTAAFTAPDITYGNLTDPQGMLEPDGDRGHTFTDATLRTAVIEGLDPEGSPLEAPMPRWQLTGSEWTDLLAYLRTLR